MSKHIQHIELESVTNSHQRGGEPKFTSLVRKAVEKRKYSHASTNENMVQNIFSHPEGQHTDLKVLKLLTDAGLSLVDVTTDILFAIRKGFKTHTKNLCYTIAFKASAFVCVCFKAFSLSLMSQEKTYSYGIIVLASCWVPAFVMIIHMISYYRENYSSRLVIYFLQIFILFICYPLGPFISFGLNLWRFNRARNNKNKKLGKIEQMINLGRDKFLKKMVNNICANFNKKNYFIYIHF